MKTTNIVILKDEKIVTIYDDDKTEIQKYRKDENGDYQLYDYIVK